MQLVASEIAVGVFVLNEVGDIEVLGAETRGIIRNVEFLFADDLPVVTIRQPLYI